LPRGEPASCERRLDLGDLACQLVGEGLKPSEVLRSAGAPGCLLRIRIARGGEACPGRASDEAESDEKDG
jgi:hypothetical protein